MQEMWPLVLVQPLTLLETVDTFLNLSGLSFPICETRGVDLGSRKAYGTLPVTFWEGIRLQSMNSGSNPGETEQCGS